MRTLVLLLLMLAPLAVHAQSDPPKREFRAVWIATVGGLDWPNSVDSDRQRAEFSSYLDVLKASGVNAIFFQVRSEGDALYVSDREPWSRVIAGAQGRAPSPFYDPLQYAIDEAHKRGMELHAWFNPFRAEVSADPLKLDDLHIVKTHPEWTITFPQTGLTLVDPGIQAARDYTASIVADVVRRYDIDGVHFDDYFYPYPNGGKGFDGITNEDDASYAADSRGISSRSSWRRDNINLFVQQVADSISAIKPHIKYGISPFGIWQSGVPRGITGLNAFTQIYADATAWVKAQSLDYLTPQLYWNFGGGQDYAKLAPWWQEQMTGGRHLYPGLGAYRDYAQTGVPRQIRFNQTSGIQGSVLFRSNNITVNGRLAEPGKPIVTNYNPLRDSLQQVLWSNPALPPTMPWKDSVVPNTPGGFVSSLTAEGVRLSWEAPPAASDGDVASWYAVYRFDQAPNLPADLDSGKNLLSVVSGDSLSYTDRSADGSTTYRYVITALDRNWNEGEAALPITVTSSIEDSEAQSGLRLFSPQPNPFSQDMTIRFALGQSERVTARVFSTLGQEVAVLASDVPYSVGTHALRWAPERLASGAYFVVVETSHARKSMVITRSR